MSQPGPWQPRTPPPDAEPPRRNRLLIFVGILAALGLIVLFMSSAFPGAARDSYDIGRAAYLVALAAMLASGFIASRRVTASQALTNIALWLGVFVVIGGAYLLKESDTFKRFEAELIPGMAIETGAHELTINADENGNFDVFGKVNGVTVRFTVDTGASDIVLSPDDAKRAGFDPANLAYGGKYETANGIGHGAFVTLDSLNVGPIAFVSVPASVNGAPMHGSLLGMTFLKRLKSFEFSKDKLVLRY